MTDGIDGKDAVGLYLDGIAKTALLNAAEEVELAWKILDPILDFWAEENTQPEGYASGSWGPQSGITMLARDGFVWRRP